MQLTKEQLTDAYEQGLSISTRNGNIKIVAILNDVYGVNHCDTNSKLVKWWMFENFERNEATIEYPKQKIDLSILKEGEIYFAKGISSYEYIFMLDMLDDYKLMVIKGLSIDAENIVEPTENDYFETSNFLAKINNLIKLRLPTESELELFYSKFPDLKPKKYNGRAVNCDSLQQLSFVAKNEGLCNKFNIETHFNNGLNCFNINDKCFQKEDYYIKNKYEIVSFSQYCTENGIVEPKWIQGFEVKDGYNDVVMVSNDNYGWYSRILKSIANNKFIDNNGNAWIYARYPRKEEINEIKFSN